MSAGLKNIRKVRGFLIDMDGTFYLGDRLLPGAAEFLPFLERNDLQYLFLTNNSSKSKKEYAHKLAALGVNVGEERIFTSGEATALHLCAKKPHARVYLVGTPALEAEFRNHGLILTEDNPDFAVLGFDTTLTYQKIATFCRLLTTGVPYIATHPDINCPTENGFIPDIGALIEMVAASTTRRPDVIIGKPHQPMVQSVAQKLGLPVESLAMVGDRLYTDIALGSAGLFTILVLSGETTVDHLSGSSIQPDWVVKDLSDLINKMRKYWP